MKKLNILTCFAFALSVVILLCGVSISKAEDFNERLTGTYAVSAVLTCTMYYDFDPFDNPTNTIHLQGLFTFYGDGTGVSEGEALLVNHNPYITGQPLPSKKTLSGSFMYSVGIDNHFIIEQELSVDGTLTISGIILKGWMGHGAQTLTISDTDLNVETLSNGVVTRICGRTGSAVKVSKINP